MNDRVMKKVVIDAGHGGKDSGTINNGIVEKDYTLKISNYINNRLKELGIESSMTRTTDELLDQTTRPQKAQSFYGKGNDVIVLSNHLNAGGGDGAEIIYSLRNSDNLSRKIATELENAGQNVRKYYQRRLPSNPSKDYYYLLRDTPNNETLIVEYGFTDSSGNDVSIIKNNWQSLAEAVVKGIVNYIGVLYTPNDNNYYIVEKGDTLWNIAKKYGITVDDLKKYNNLQNNNLTIGQKLKVALKNEENYYIVKYGDTLYKIAKDYDITVDGLKAFNNLSSNIISVGQKLKIPANSDKKEYIIKAGDTLYKIAKMFNVTIDDLKRINNLTSDILSIGQKLIVK